MIYGKFWAEGIYTLDKTSYKALKCLYRKKQCKYEEIQLITKHPEKESSSKFISNLFSNQFIKNWNSGNIIMIGGINENEIIGFEITLQGEAYIEQRIREVRNFWVPYSITTFIAFLSLLGTLVEHWDTIQSWFCHMLG